MDGNGIPFLPRPLVDPEHRRILAAFMKQHEEVTEERDNLKHQLSVTQVMLIICLRRMGGHIDLERGEIDNVQKGKLGVKSDDQSGGKGGGKIRVSAFQGRAAVSDYRKPH